MGLPPDSVVEFTLARMRLRLEQRAPEDVSHEQGGLLFLGNPHDAFPRRLFLDNRLSPLDKMAWVMIRMYAQQHEGAVFPTYDELQQLLALPHSERASRETVSRALLMLRLTGWLSLCKRVRDKAGRVRGNIYAQHDEPLSCRDAEAFDPGWLDRVAVSCRNKNRTVRLTALAVLDEVVNDPTMRHHHSRLALINTRLAAPSTPVEAVTARHRASRGSDTELRHHRLENRQKLPGSETELRQESEASELSAETKLSTKSTRYAGVRKPNCNVRKITHSVNKKTYVAAQGVNTDTTLTLPDTLTVLLKPDEIRMLHAQLNDLPDNVARGLLDLLQQQLRRSRLNNPMGWMLAMLKRARNGELVVIDTYEADMGTKRSDYTVNKTALSISEEPAMANTPSVEQVTAIVAAIRETLLCEK